MQKQLGSRFFIVFLLCSLALLLGLFWAYISAIVLALLIASVFYPIYSWVKRRLKNRETSASLFMTLFIFLVLIIPASGFVTTLSNEAFEFYNTTRNTVSLQKIQEAMESDSIWVQRIKKIGNMVGIEFTPETLEMLTASVGKKVGLFLYNQGRSMASNIFSLLVHFFLMMMTIYYLFRDGMRLKDYIGQEVSYIHAEGYAAGFCPSPENRWKRS